IDLVGSKVLRATKADTTGGGGTAPFFEDSGSFEIIHAAASTFAWTLDPVDTVAGQNILATLEIRDAFTNIVTTGADATALVTLNKQTGTGTLSGTVAKNAVA